MVKNLNRLLGYLFVPIVILLLLTSEIQDRTIELQHQAIEFWQWAAGVPLPRRGIVTGHESNGCTKISLDDPFPLGYNVALCIPDLNDLPTDTRVIVYIRGHEIHSITILQ